MFVVLQPRIFSGGLVEQLFIFFIWILQILMFSNGFLAHSWLGGKLETAMSKKRNIKWVILVGRHIRQTFLKGWSYNTFLEKSNNNTLLNKAYLHLNNGLDKNCANMYVNIDNNLYKHWNILVWVEIMHTYVNTDNLYKHWNKLCIIVLKTKIIQAHSMYLRTFFIWALEKHKQVLSSSIVKYT